MKTSALLKERAQQAARLQKQLESIQKDLDKIPSFTGKARFMDKVIKANRHAQALSANLDLDQKLENQA